MIWIFENRYYYYDNSNVRPLIELRIETGNVSQRQQPDQHKPTQGHQGKIHFINCISD